MASAPQIKLLVAGGVPTVNDTQPFLPLNPIGLLSPGAAVLYGINKQSENSAFYARFEGDGSTAVFDAGDNANLANADDQATITAANYLNTVVLANGIALTRVASGATPTAGQFKISTVSSVITLTLGTAYGVGTKIEAYMAPTTAVAVIVTGAATAIASQKEEIVCYDFMRATTANAVIEGLGH